MPPSIEILLFFFLLLQWFSVRSFVRVVTLDEHLIRSYAPSWLFMHAFERSFWERKKTIVISEWMREERKNVMWWRVGGEAIAMWLRPICSWVCVCVLRFYFLMIIFCLPFSPLASLLFTALYCHFVRQTLQQMCGHLASVMSVTLLAMEIFSHRLTNFTRSRLNDDDVSYHLTKKDVTHLFFNRCSVMSTVQIPFTD